MKDENNALADASFIAVSLAFPMTLRASIELGLLDIIVKKEMEIGPVTASQVAAELPTENPLAADMVERMLNLLASFAVLRCFTVAEKGKVFEVTPVGRYFIKDEEGGSLGPLLILLTDKIFMKSWHNLKDAVLEGGIPFIKAHGIHAFEYEKIDPEFNEIFNYAMYNHTTMIMKEVIQSYKGFEGINQLVDVGGGLGYNLKVVLSKYPNVKGINFDLPHVVQNGIPHPGIKYVGGDMFEGVACGDAIFMKWILHDWSDENCVKILTNCHKALPHNGKVIVMEGIMSDDESETTIDTRIIRAMDITILTQTLGGKERTKDEFYTLAKTAGFARITFETYVTGYWIMEFHK